MHAEPAIQLSTLYAFAFVLARMAGVFVFLPLLGIGAGSAASRVVLSLVATLSLFSRWPNLHVLPSNIAELTGWLLAEVALGLSIGIAVSIIIESFTMGAQLITLQAGFSYASTIDPSNNADSTVLVVMAQLTAAILFFATGLDRQVLVILANSLDSAPPGVFTLTRPHVETLLMTGGMIFTTGLRLVLPIMTLLFLVDLSLGLMGRLNAQLHIFTLSIPMKMLATLGLLSGTLLIFPRVFTHLSAIVFQILRQVLGT